MRLRYILVLFVFSSLMAAAFYSAALASPSDRTVSSISLNPDNTFDNQLIADGSDSGTFIMLNLSGGAAAAENPDNEGGYRLEIYNAGGTLMRRLASREIDTAPTTAVRFNGQGDSQVNDTLAYGAYTLRAYSSFRNPTVVTSIKGSGITIDRPGDLHVTSGGVLTWINTGAKPAFCQVSLGDPNTANPTFLRLVEFDTGLGYPNTDRAWGVTMNSANRVFVTDNFYDGLVGMRIAKYNTTTETWQTLTWATDPTTSLADDEWGGMGIDNKDSIYIAGATGPFGGGAGGGVEMVTKLQDVGATGTDSTRTSQTEDYYDVAPFPSGDSYIYAVDRQFGQIDRYNANMTTDSDPWSQISPTLGPRSIWVTTQGRIYVTNFTLDSFAKLRSDGTLQYMVQESRLDGATGIAVYQKASTNETFVCVASQLTNQINIYKEDAAGDTATFVRTIADDVYNLQTPEGIGVDPDSALFVVNRGSRTVKKFTQDGVFSALSGATNGQYLSGVDVTTNVDDSNAFNVPRAIAVDTAGNIYVFDANSAATQFSLKKFSPSGVPLGMIFDIDAKWASGIFNTNILAATWGKNAIYAVTAENAGRVLRISETGSLLSHLGATATVDGDAADGNTAADVVGLQIGPYFDTTLNRFFPEALYIYLVTDVVEVWQSNFAGGARLSLGTPQEVTGTNPSANPQAFLVDDKGEVYWMNTGLSAGNYIFRKFNANDSGLPFLSNSMMEFTFGQGSGASQFNAPRQAVWTDNPKGNFAWNPSTARYERKIWINDSANNRLQQVLLAWNHAAEGAVTISLNQDTPLVSSAAVASETVTTINGQYYVGVSTCTVNVSFNKSMVTAPNPDTITVQFKPNGGSFTSMNQTSYSGTSWTGTMAILPGMADGEAIIKVADAYDNDGTVRFIDPNPDQTDFDVSDDFKPFVIDKTAPAFSVSAPSVNGESVSTATYTVTGQITTEATGLDATVQLINWTDSTGATQFDSVTNTASSVNGAFSGILNLKAAPSKNWIEVVAIDKLSNRNTLSPRRLIDRIINRGSAFVEPATETIVTRLRAYEVTYTAAQSLAIDTLRLTVPTGWSAPQKSDPATNGFVTIVETGAYTDSTISGQVITILGVSRSIGQILRIRYGDSVTSLSGRAAAGVDVLLDNASNTFKVELQLTGETTFAGVAAASGKSLTSPMKDSDVGVAIVETGPGATVPFTVIPKGTETKVLTVRFYNSNLGNHDIRVSQIGFKVESETGGPLFWLNVASRVVVKNTGEGITFADITSLPAGADLANITPSNLTISQGASRDVEFWVTFSSTATADTARFFFSGLGAFTAVDSASGKAILMLSQDVGATSRKSGNYDIIGFAPADTLSLSADTSITPTDVATGQTDVALMDILFKNEPPHVDTPVNTIRVDQITLSIRDTSGVSLTPSHVVRGIYLRDAATGIQYGGLDTPSIPNNGDTVVISLSGLDVASNATVTGRVWVSIVIETASANFFRARFVETTAVIAKDKTTNFTINKIRDDPATTDRPPFQTNPVTIQRKAHAGLASITFLRTDSTITSSILAGDQFFVALRCTAAPGGASVRVIPADTDLRFAIGGTNITSEFTVVGPAAKTIAAGGEDTITYSCVQNLGASTGLVTAQMADTGADTRTRFYDNHQYTGASQLRATLALPVPTNQLTISASPFDLVAYQLDTTYANSGETAVPILHFSMKNNQGSNRTVDSVVVTAISPDSAIKQVRLYHDNRNGVLNRSDSATPVAGLDTLLATGTLAVSDSTVTLVFSPKVTVGTLSTESFFVAFDFDNTVNDNDTFDARIPANGVRVSQEVFAPASTLVSGGTGRLEIVATRVTVTPDTQIVAVSSSVNITMKAVDAFGNLDNTINYETSVQGRNVQVTVTVSDAIAAADTRFSITATSGMTSVTPTPATTGISSINGNLASGQGQVTIRDTTAETVAITIASVLVDSVAAIQYANLITVSSVNLVSTDSGGPDSRAYEVAKFRVVNQSGANDQVITIGVRSLNSNDSHVSAVIVFRDDNGNSVIDSGTDATIGTGNFTSGFVTFEFLTVDVFDQDSKLFMVGYNVSTSITDAATLDAQVDTVVINSSLSNIASQLNSTPNRRSDVKVAKLSISPQTATTGTGSNVTVTVKAVDAYANTDIHYNGQTGITWDLTGAGYFVSTTLANEDIDPPPDPPFDNSQVKGNLVSGAATLTFSDNSEETPVLSVVTSPGLTATHDTGAYVFQQGYLATVLNADQKLVDPGDTNVVLMAFKVSATGTSDSISRIVINWQSRDSSSVRNVRIFRDLDANDTFTLAGDTRYGEAVSFIGDVDTFVAVYSNDTPYVANGTNRSFFVVADIADTAVGTDTVDVQLLTASITTQTNIPNVPTGIRNSSGNCTVARVPDTFRVGIVSTSNRQASEDQTEIIPMTLRFSSPNATDRKFYVETFSLMVEGLAGGVAPSTRIARAQLRNQATSVVYMDKVGIESTGDSMSFAIRFDSANPVAVGGVTPETITVDVVLTIAATVTQNDTFRLRVNALDTTWATVWDHPLSTLAVRRQKGNVAVLSPSSLPLLGSIVTVQKKAIVTQQAIRITDVAGADIIEYTQGEQFKVEVGLLATASRANAQVRSADTDLTFRRGNGDTNITSEFTINSRTHSTLTTITAGTVDTVTYTVTQGSPFSGPGETLVINNFLSTDTGPYLQDVNSSADAVKLRVYAVEDAVSTDAVRINSSYATVSIVTLSANNIAPDSTGTRILAFRITDGGVRDTLTGVQIRLTTPTAASMIKSCWIAIDTNKNGVYDSTAVGGDTYFGTVKDFKSSDTVYFVSKHPMYGSGDTREFWMCINLETSPVTDSTQIKVEIVIDGLGFSTAVDILPPLGVWADQAEDSIPKTVQTNSALFRTIIVATKIVASPDTQNISVDGAAAISLRAEDSYGNLNTRTTSFAAASVTCRINDTWTPDINRSARWTSTNLASQSPASLPSASYYDTLVTGNLAAGIATVNMTDTQSETVAILITHATLAGDTVTVSWTTDPSVTAVSMTALSKITPDSTDAVILQFDVSFPATLSTVDSLYVVSENTFDTAIKRLRLWTDSNGNSSFSAATDSNIDTAAWSAGGCSFLINRNFVKPATINTIRFFVTAHIETGPLTDNDSIGARIDTAGIRLTPGGNFPPTGQIDAIVVDTQNAVIDVDALQTGGSVRFVSPGSQVKDQAFTMTARAEDKFGNLDRVFTTLGSSAGRNVTLSASPTVFTFNSTSMTQVSGWPGATPVARFRLGSDTINLTPTGAGTITMTGDVTTSPPADTTIDVVVIDTSVVLTIVADSLALTSDTFSSGAANVVILYFNVQNGKATNDSVQTITLKNNGSHPDTGITNIRIFIDVNKNGTFNSGTDTPFGASGGVFTAGSLTRTDSALVPAGDSVRFIVVVNLSPTLTVDSQTLRARIDTSGITMFSGDTACTRPLLSGGVTKIAVIFNPAITGALDSVTMNGGTGIADNIDTVTVSVTVRDTNGVPAADRTVWLTGDTGAPITVVSSNPQTTPQNGVVSFVLRTGTVNTYNYSASVNGTNSGQNATAIFISVNKSAGGNLGGSPANNVQQAIVTGTTKTFLGNIAFGETTNPNTMVYIKGDGTNWQLVKQNVGGAPTALLSKSAAAGSESGQVNFVSSLRVANTKTVLNPGGAEYALAGIIHRAEGRRSQIYAVDMTTGDSTRLTPNDPFEPGNVPFINNGFRFFDMHPSGDTIACVLDGNILSWAKASDTVWNNYVDSGKMRWITSFFQTWGLTGSATNSEIYCAYPEWSPDGKRLAFTLCYVSDAFPSGPAVDRADIYVIHNMDSIVYGIYPNNPFLATLTDTALYRFTRVAGNQNFAFHPRWTRDGSGLVYSVARGPDFDWQRMFTDPANDNTVFDASNYVTRFIYYDKATESTPYAAIDISTESIAGSGSLDIAMPHYGEQRLAYIRKSKAGSNRVYELRTVKLDTETIITPQGGVLFDSGRIIVVVPSSESYGLGFKIGGTRPESNPANSESIIITGAGKSFYAPGSETASFYFADTITIFIYYTASDFTDTEKQGYDSDGDGIPDRTEAALSVYFYNGSTWLDYKAVRYPTENKLEFKTRHFSHYAAGLPMEARALAFSGSVANVIAYPNPWRADGPTSGLATTNEAYGIKMTRMPGPNVRVRIYTLAGELLLDGTVNSLKGTSTSQQLRVTALIFNDADALGTISWNLKNQSGRDVASGVYLIVLEGPGGKAVRKVAVMR